ncbi:MAG: TetR/AcrR family transcriptional regulator [Aquisalimonadaceae bacterium]
MSTTAKRAGFSARRDQLLETATELFYRNGCHTTGIDRILAEAGVAKMTLYKHFRSKEELVLAASQRFHDQLREDFQSFVEQGDLSPRQQLLAIFEFMANWCQKPGFCGCPSINLAVQYPDHADPIHRAAAEHKRIREQFIANIARQAGAEKADQLARALMLLIEGATVLRQVTGRSDFVREAGDAAEVLVSHYLG